MTSPSLTRDLTVPGSDRVQAHSPGVSTPAATSTLKAGVGRRKRSLSRYAAQPGISTNTVAETPPAKGLLELATPPAATPAMPSIPARCPLRQMGTSLALRSLRP
jgi:hypothetical protein